MSRKEIPTSGCVRPKTRHDAQPMLPRKMSQTRGETSASHRRKWLLAARLGQQSQRGHQLQKDAAEDDFHQVVEPAAGLGFNVTPRMELRVIPGVHLGVVGAMHQTVDLGVGNQHKAKHIIKKVGGHPGHILVPGLMHQIGHPGKQPGARKNHEKQGPPPEQVEGVGDQKEVEGPGQKTGVKLPGLPTDPPLVDVLSSIRLDHSRLSHFFKNFLGLAC